MDECDSLTKSRRRDGCCGADYSTTDDHDVETSGVDRLFWQATELSPPSPRGLINFIWGRDWLFAEEYRVAASAEAGRIVKRQPGFASPQPDFASKFPVPVLVIGAEFDGQDRVVDDQLEPTRMMAWDPVFSTHPNVIFAGLGYGHHGSGVCDRFAVAVSKKIGRTHLQLELGVQHPAAVVGEAFCLDQDSR